MPRTASSELTTRRSSGYWQAQHTQSLTSYQGEMRWYGRDNIPQKTGLNAIAMRYNKPLQDCQAQSAWLLGIPSKVLVLIAHAEGVW